MFEVRMDTLAAFSLSLQRGIEEMKKKLNVSIIDVLAQ